MANITITLSATTSTPHPLTINDHISPTTSTEVGDHGLTTGVNPGDIITWQVDTNSDMESITNIIDNSSPTNLFSSGPSRISDTVWQGTIGPRSTTTNPSGTVEFYTIEYNVRNASDNPYSQDPQLKMN